jgi:PadR family transcriptional regulator PadR
VEEGWISSFWGESKNSRRAKYYRQAKGAKEQGKVEPKPNAGPASL